MLNPLGQAGVQGIEVAPSRVWQDTWRGLDAASVTAYRTAVEKAGLRVVGLHSLFYDHPELGLFKDGDFRQKSLNFLIHLSKVCRDLGGSAMIWGSGRRRNELPLADAEREAVDFMGELCHRIEDHGTVICFEPLGPKDSDFINGALEALSIVDKVSHSSMAIQLDAKALVENAESEMKTFEKVKSELVHFHANEPGLDVLGRSGTVDHQALGCCLKAIGYDHFVSIEQRMFGEETALDDALESLGVLKSSYS